MTPTPEMERLAEEYGYKIAQPVIRSMMPMMSRGEFAKHLADAHRAGFQAAQNSMRLTDEEIRQIRLARENMYIPDSKDIEGLLAILDRLTARKDGEEK